MPVMGRVMILLIESSEVRLPCHIGVKRGDDEAYNHGEPEGDGGGNGEGEDAKPRSDHGQSSSHSEDRSRGSYEHGI